MKAAFTGTIVLALVFSASPCLSEDDAPRRKTISEEEARIVSARLYEDLLITACKNGWRYSWKQVTHGFKRHFQELKLQLSNDGYTIVSTTVASDDDMRRPAMVTAAGKRNSPTFGCARQYWLETRAGILQP